tara:strand:+ start:4170 stop:4703 length:534 start_codon:yes stop_codon:yes gene_type:complete
MNVTVKALIRIALIFSGLCMLLMLSVSVADVVAYLVLARPFPGANEMVEVALAVCVAMTIAFAHHERAHVRVDLISQQFPKKVARVTEFFSLILAVACTGLLAYGAWKMAVASVHDRETAVTLYSFPIYPWKVLFAFGFTVAAAESVRQLILACLGKSTPDIDTSEDDQLKRNTTNV